MKPLFIFSLPRSGSTLLQRMLAGHRQIDTAQESWLLLPVIYSLRPEGCYTEYGHARAVEALEGLFQQLPNGKEDYLAEIHDFIMGVYTRLAESDVEYFIDKTPRYHLVVREIQQLFPTAKCIFLWRNPLAVVASMMETWAHGRWNLYRFKIDLFEGLMNLVDAVENHRSSHVVRYEDLVSDPERELKAICEYLGIPFQQDLPSAFADVRLAGGMGDQTGLSERRVNERALHKWQSTVSNPMRKAWCRRYLRWIGEERLRIMGYEMKALLNDLDAAPANLRQLPGDLALAAFGVFYCLTEPRICRHKLSSLPSWHKVHAHN